MTKKPNQGGFTLIELLVVLVIGAVLLTIFAWAIPTAMWLAGALVATWVCGWSWVQVVGAIVTKRVTLWVAAAVLILLTTPFPFIAAGALGAIGWAAFRRTSPPPAAATDTAPPTPPVA